MRKCQKLLPCLIEPFAAASKIDGLRAKAEPINNGSNAYRITDTRRKNCWATAAGERAGNMSEKELCRQQGRGRSRRCSRPRSRGSPAARGEGHGAAALRGPAAHGDPQGS